jgi:hypothetical protein
VARPGAGAILVAAIAGTIGMVAAASRAGGAGGSGPTRADLDATRRRLARMESEYALVQTRKPYLVLDAGARVLTVRLMGMTVREVPMLGLEARGLLPARDAAEGAAPLRVAGIVTLKEKENDPRLTPLSAEQIEAGADDENAADALPPPIPAGFRLFFRQSLVVPVESRGQDGSLGGVWTRLRQRFARALGSDERAEQSGAKLALTIHLETVAAQELYRSLLPGERVLMLPPAGLVLPDVGQELPKSLRPGKAPAPSQAGPQAAPGVPFRIPAPVEELPPPDGGAGGESAPVPAQRLDAPPPAEGTPPDGAPPSEADSPSTGSNSSAVPQSTPAPPAEPEDPVDLEAELRRNATRRRPNSLQ